MTAPGDLPPDQAARVVAAMRSLIETRFGTNAALARAIKRSGSSVGAWVAADPKHGPSLETARRIAKLQGVRLEDLLSGAAGALAAPPDAYPERAAALARLAGLLPDEVAARLRSVVVHDDRPLSEVDWLELALMRLREHERAAALEGRVSGEADRHR